MQAGTGGGAARWVPMDILRDPFISIVTVIVIGLACGLLLRLARGRRVQIDALTAILVGIAGAFLGFHAAMLSGVGTTQPVVPSLIAAAGSALVLWGWRMTRR